MLGPLEVLSADRAIGLGGTKQRATLGFLLLQANQVVPTSQLLRALWSTDEAPTSARKILQNAVWGLRGALAAPEGEPAPAELRTQPPGYVLRVDPAEVDLHVFNQRVAAGRARLADGRPQEAGVLLRDALSLWRGPALADLVECGTIWPELAAVQNTRLDVQEDYFDAALACGQHYAVLGSLEMMVEAEPLRERSCGQLMLALYRCGRQADALGVYSRVRTALVEDLGLEPGRELQRLQQAILTHDPELHLPEGAGSPVAAVAPGAEPAGGPAGPAAPAAPAAGTPTVPAQRAAAPAPGPADAPPRRRPAAVVAERREASLLLLRAGLDAASDTLEPERVSRVLERVTALIQKKVEEAGGVVAGAMGSVTLALFAAGEGGAAEGARRAVRAACAVRESLTRRADSLSSPAEPRAALALHAAVSTGATLVRRDPGDPAAPVSVNGVLLDECQALLAAVPAGEIRVCERTRRHSADAVGYRQVPGEGNAWQVGGRDARPARTEPGDLAAEAARRTQELGLLRGLLEHTRHRAVPHLATVLAESDTEATALLREFRRWAVGQGTEVAGSVLVSVPPGGAAGPAGVQALQAAVLAGYCGVEHGAPRARAVERLIAALGELAETPERTQRMAALLRPLLAPGGPAAAGVSPEHVTEAWHAFLRSAARERPLVLAVQGLHHADGPLLDLVENLPDALGVAPVLIVAAARPELFDRRPGWSGGKRHTTTITLDAQGENVMDRLLESLLVTAYRDLRPSPAVRAG
ncbi:BTAD domain-containing putative transcriptional regulator [Streptomyces sp. TRM 70351]|uniref:BTAD domain-containing putative transcriptional regulator n=1 Tax=Streptomyces sp. TRM 70351 TaxID=3116552 RepID=UPI002E7AB3E6|nr:BTAD domain-containing putative transcriptional regulator [Streptomyces sp. TRM 70351]MEE1929751.1 BTAD domain-containing putative transcriptional regulator [Streptomyces sp. TRM 70351]